MKIIMKNIPYVIWGIIKILLTSSIGAVLFTAVCMGLASPLSTYVYIYGDGVEYMSVGYVYFSSIIGLVLYSVIAYVLLRPETEEEKREAEQRYHDTLMEAIRGYHPER